MLAIFICRTSNWTKLGVCVGNGKITSQKKNWVCTQYGFWVVLLWSILFACMSVIGNDGCLTNSPCRGFCGNRLRQEFCKRTRYLALALQLVDEDTSCTLRHRRLCGDACQRVRLLVVQCCSWNSLPLQDSSCPASCRTDSTALQFSHVQTCCGKALLVRWVCIQ